MDPLSKSILNPTILYEDVEAPSTPVPPSHTPSPALAPSASTPPPEFLQESLASALASPQPTRASRLIDADRAGSASLLQEVPVNTILSDSQPLTSATDAGRGDNAPPFANIRVLEPTKLTEGLKSYMAYKILYEPLLAPEGACRRRFNDFVWLHAQLRAKHKGMLIPPLPERDDFVWDKFTQAFIETRMRALATFLQRVTAHPTLGLDPHVQVFFEESPERLALLRAGHDIDLQEAEVAVKPEKTAAASGGGWFSSVSSYIPYVAAVPPPDPDERFVRMSTRVTALHAAFQGLATKCGAVLQKENELGEAFKAMGLKLASIVVTEKDSDPKYYSQLSRCASNLSVVHDITSAKLAEEGRVVLEEAVKDITRLCQAAEDLLADRKEALATWMALRSKRVAAKDEASHRADVAQHEQTVQRISASVISELDSFNALLYMCVRHALRHFAALQMRHHTALAVQWRDSLPDGS